MLSKEKASFIVLLKTPQNLVLQEGLDETSRLKAIASVAKSRINSYKNDPDITKFEDYSVLPMVAIKANKAGLLKIAALPDVIAVYENKKRYKNLQQSLPLINQPIVASQNHKGAGTSIAILDTGVNYTNSAFE